MNKTFFGISLFLSFLTAAPLAMAQGTVRSSAQLEAEAAAERAWELLASREFRAAADAAGAALARSPGNPELREVLGWAFLEMGDLKRAMEEFEGAAVAVMKGRRFEELSPREREQAAFAHLGGADVLVRLDRPAAAKGLLAHSIYLFPTAAAYERLGSLIRTLGGDLDLSAAFLRTAHEQSPESAANRISLAALYIEHGKRQEAEALIGGLSSAEEQPWKLAAYYSAAGDTAKALEYFRRAMELYRDYPEAQAWMREAAGREKDFRNLKNSAEYGALTKNPGSEPAAAASETTAPVSAEVSARLETPAAADEGPSPPDALE